MQRAQDASFALAVDRIHDHEELVVKPAAPAVMATGLYAGTTLADDGSPILLLDPAGLAEVGGVKLESVERAARIAVDPETKQARSTEVLLFRGLDGSRKAIRLALVDRIEEVEPKAIRKAAGQLRAQVGEAILPLAGATKDQLGTGKVRLFRVNDGNQEVAYAFAEVLDFATLDHEVIHSDQQSEVGAVTLVNGEPAELIDAHWLFASLTGTARPSREPPVCHLPGNDPWIHNLLRPIVEAAGYRVTGDSDEQAEAPDLVIATKGAEGAETLSGGRTIWLRTDPDAQGKKDDSIYRYDRAGLLMALKSVASGRGQ